MQWLCLLGLSKLIVWLIPRSHPKSQSRKTGQIGFIKYQSGIESCPQAFYFYQIKLSLVIAHMHVCGQDSFKECWSYFFSSHYHILKIGKTKRYWFDYYNDDNNPARFRALRALGLLLADGTPTGGRGEDFLSRQPNFFTETAVTPERKVEKSFPRWEINRHVEG